MIYIVDVYKFTSLNIEWVERKEDSLLENEMQMNLESIKN